MQVITVGDRVRIGEVQFCVEARGLVGTVSKIYRRPYGLLADVRLDEAMRVQSGTAHWNVRGVLVDDLSHV